MRFVRPPCVMVRQGVKGKGAVVVCIVLCASFLSGADGEKAYGPELHTLSKMTFCVR